MTFEIHQPAPVLLPEDSGLQREFRTSRIQSAGGRRFTLDDEDYAQYDSRTLFYDVFRREEDPRRVVALGPPPVNLEPELQGLRVSHVGRALRHRLLWYSRFPVVELTLDGPAAAEREPELDFAFPSFTARVRVPPCAQEVPAPSSKGRRKGLLAAEPIAMMTLQKDNEIAWIEDWCRWHRRLHDVTCFRIYDNDSANIGPLEEALRRLGEEMDIALVRWPFPYGPSRWIGSMFAQQGALNHYRMQFGPRDAWCLSMDVDEYLTVSGERPLREILAASERAGIVSLRVDSYLVPPHCEQRPVPERRVWHHVWRERRLREEAWKYAYIPSRTAWSYIHSTWHGNRFFARGARGSGIGRRLFQFWYRKVPRRLERLERSDIRSRRAGAWLLRRILPGLRRMRLHSPDELFFFHFRGLNTNWKGRGLGERTEPFEPERHVEDPRIRAFAEQAGLVPPGAGAPKGEDAGMSKWETPPPMRTK